MSGTEHGGSGSYDAGSVIDGFVRRYYADVLRYCRWHTPDRASAEDAAQETFLKFVRFSDRFSDSGRTKAFLYRIAANTCTDLLRKRRAEGLPEYTAYEEGGFSRAEAAVDVEALLRLLDEGQRELVLLRFAQELSLREIAEVTGMPLRTVQSRLRRALQIMRTAGKGERYDG